MGWVFVDGQDDSRVVPCTAEERGVCVCVRGRNPDAGGDEPDPPRGNKIVLPAGAFQGVRRRAVSMGGRTNVESLAPQRSGGGIQMLVDMNPIHLPGDQIGLEGRGW